MLIDCPNCTRSYQVSTDDVGERGRAVICPRCDARWFLRREDVAVAPALDIGLREHRSQPGLDEMPASLVRWRLREARPAACAVLAVALAMGLVVGREAVVRAVPRTAALYALAGAPVNVRGLEIGAVAAQRLGGPDMALAGEIRNITARRVAVPRVMFVVRDAGGAPLMSWSEAPPARLLAAGRSLRFASAPRRLPPEGRTVLVHFEPPGA